MMSATLRRRSYCCVLALSVAVSWLGAPPLLTAEQRPPAQNAEDAVDPEVARQQQIAGAPAETGQA